MSEETAASEAAPETSDESFAALFEEYLRKVDIVEGSVVKGKVIAVANDMALIDVGLKAEGRVPLKEFAPPGKPPEVTVGDEVEVYLERIEGPNGEAVLSRDKARRAEAWVQLEKAFQKNERVDGLIVGRVKGGFTVDFSGALAFLPGSQVDIRPVRDIAPLMGTTHQFQILKMDRRRGNIVVSRRAVLEEDRAEARNELIAALKEGQVLDGVVKNITDYGAFVDLGGVDGLLHVTDVAWRRINHPSEALSIGQTVKVQVIRFNPETQRISLGMKQLERDPWEGVEAKYPVGVKFTGRVTNITDYGAFVELEAGVEGLAHVSEMSWTKKNVDPGKIVSTSQQVEVIVLDVDAEKRRISLGLKQCQENPWEAFREKHPVGSEVEGTVKNITEFGLFVGLESDIDGMVHMSDISWDRPGEEAIADYKKGSRVKAKVLDVDLDKERISLGIKQLTVDSFAKAVAKLKRGDIVTCVVTAVQTNGVEVAVNEGAPGFVRKSDLSRDRADQRPEKFAVGDKLDGKITSIDRTGRRLTLSIKALEFAQEKEAMAAFGSSDSGASLGDILGPAISSATRRAEAEARAAQGEKATKAEEAPAGADEPARGKAEERAGAGRKEKPKKVEKAIKAEEAPAGADEPARGKAEERAGAGRKEKPKKVKKAIKAEPAPAGADEPARGKADGEGGDAGAEPAAEDEGSRRGTEEGEAESEPAASTTKEENEKEGKA